MCQQQKLLLAGRRSTGLWAWQIGKVLVRKGDSCGVTKQSKQETGVLYTEVVCVSQQTPVVITLHSKGEFIDYKEPAAIL